MLLETPLREQHEHAGASLQEYFGCLLPKAFSDFSSEYRHAREAVALLDTNYLAFLTLEGPDRVRYLNAVATNNIQQLSPGQGTLALLLNPQGHILAELECYLQAEKLLALSHAAAREQTIEWLNKYIIMDDVTLEDRTNRSGGVALEGPQADAILKELACVAIEGMAEFAHVEANLDSIPCRIVRRSHFGAVGAEILAGREDLGALWVKLCEAARSCGGGPVGYAALNALRLEAGIPWFGSDFDDTMIPHEAALEKTHLSFTKGCYTGQEIVERVRSRGHVNRLRIGLKFSGATAPEKGTRLTAAGKEVGHVTSTAFSPALGRVIGMGYLRREHSTLGSLVKYPGGTAEVIELPIFGARLASAGVFRH